MKMSHLFTKTSKTVPADEESRNAQLLIQGGYIHKEMAGVYAYLPLGKRVLDNISRIVREEMDAIGGQEVQMTVLQPKEIWEKTDRWDDKKVDNWFKTKLANGTELGVGLTHEEAVVDSVRDYVRSYKDLPIYPYQIQSKFRNELRAKAGLMRGREFLMKDMYSFSRTTEEHEAFYEIITEAYHRIYQRLGLGDVTYTCFASGGIFSKFSREFQTLSPVGEDTIYVDKSRNIAINKEVYNDDVIAELGLNKADLVEEKAVEVGNIFPLGSKYADALDVRYTDEEGNEQSIIMGSYGIGVSRLMGLLAEHFADDRGLAWPENVAPYTVYLASVFQPDKPGEVAALADNIYEQLTSMGVTVLYDDRGVRAGQKFADADLLGIPYRLVISDKTISSDRFEWKSRTAAEPAYLTHQELLDKLKG
jgi:prolyl-tRNA synthetase